MISIEINGIKLTPKHPRYSQVSFIVSIIARRVIYDRPLRRLVDSHIPGPQIAVEDDRFWSGLKVIQ